MLVRLKTSLTWGSFAGMWAAMYCIMEAILLFVVETFLPERDIDILPSFDRNTVIDQGLSSYYEQPLVFGDHEFRVGALTTHSVDQSIDTKQGVLLDLYSNTDKQINESSEKEIRRFKRTSRYTVVKPKVEDMIVKPITNVQPVCEKEQLASE